MLEICKVIIVSSCCYLVALSADMNNKLFNTLKGKRLIGTTETDTQGSLVACAVRCAEMARTGACHLAGYDKQSKLCSVTTDRAALINSLTDTNHILIDIVESKEYKCPILQLNQADYTKFDLHNDGVRVDIRTSIAFQAKGKSDAHILLQKDRKEYSTNIVEIVLGGWSNTKSVIRNVQQGAALYTFNGTVLDENSYAPFWISWSEGCVKVGKGMKTGCDVIMLWCGISYSIVSMRISYCCKSGGFFKFEI